ncbi:MAG: AraC family transcriptional regulator [Acidobacteriota bacterium]
MVELPQDFRQRFVGLLRSWAPEPGLHRTSWPGLLCFRADGPTVPDPTLYCPAICVVGQGMKEATLGEHVFRYDPLNYLVIGAALPVRARVCEASPEQPFLSLVLEVDTASVHDLVLEMGDELITERWPQTAAPIRLSTMDQRFLSAVVRLLEAVEDSMDRRILAPAALREILYLVLRGEQGHLLHQLALRDARSQGVTRALRYIQENLEERLDVPKIAQEAGMSVSSLHHNFKRATTLTPVQYLKQIRLHRARQLILDEGCQAAEAALRVGYESPSQFSREFKRFFGLPPRRYAESWVEGVVEAGS